MTDHDDTVAERLVSVLEAHGVRDLFALCGNHVLPILEAVRHRDLRVTATRAEAAAVMAADGYGRVARRVGVALVTGGPGLANTVGALLGARGNRSPVVLISGEPDRIHEGRGAQQEADHLGLSRAAVKWNRIVRDPAHVEEALVEAFKLAQAGPSGPVHVSIPLDVQRAPAGRGAVPPSGREIVAPTAPPAFVSAAAARVRAAERPVLIAGAGLWQRGGEHATARLVARTGIPLFTLDSARGIVADSARSVLGSADVALNRAAANIARADVVVVVGRPIDFRLGLGASFAAEAAVIHVDDDVETLGRNARNVAMCGGDPAAFVADLAEQLEGHRVADGWIDSLTEDRRRELADVDALAAGDGDVAHPAAVARAIARVGVDRGAIFALDCGEFVQWCRQTIPAEAPGRWLRLGPQSACGSGLPFGIGAKAASPQSPVVVIAGDGGIGYHISELETTVRNELPVVVVVGRDGGWGIEQSLQRGIYGAGSEFTTDLTLADLPGVAAGWGAVGRHVAGVAELEDAIADALDSGRPTLLQTPVRNVPSRVTTAMVKRERDASAAASG